MSHRGLDPRDYEYDGSESAEVYSSAPATEVAAAERSSRFRLTSAVTTIALASAGLLGGAAFAMSQVPLNQSPSSAPMVETPAANITENGTAASAAPTESASPEDTANSAASGTTTGKTIAVPPAAFEDKHGERDFHTSAPSGGASSGPTTSPTSGAAAPSFGGGDDGSDDGGEHHHKRGIKPTPGSTASPNFGNNEDD